MSLSVRPETDVLFREATRALEKERGEKLDEDAVMEALCRAHLSGARTESRAPSVEPDAVARPVEPDSVPRGSEDGSREVRASAAAPYRVAVTVSRECKRGWQHGAGASRQAARRAHPPQRRTVTMGYSSCGSFFDRWNRPLKKRSGELKKSRVIR